MAYGQFHTSRTLKMKGKSDCRKAISLLTNYLLLMDVESYDLSRFVFHMNGENKTQIGAYGVYWPPTSNCSMTSNDSCSIVPKQQFVFSGLKASRPATRESGCRNNQRKEFDHQQTKPWTDIVGGQPWKSYQAPQA